MEPIKLFSNRDYSDEVQRITVPKRIWAETYLKMNLVFIKEELSILKSLAAFAKTMGQMDDDLLSVYSIMPTEKAFDAIQYTTLVYNYKEFDRIYS